MGLWDLIKGVGSMAYNTIVPQAVKDVIVPFVPSVAETLKSVVPGLSKQIDDVKNILVDSSKTLPASQVDERIIKDTIQQPIQAVKQAVDVGVKAVRKMKKAKKAKKMMSVVL